VTRVAMLQLLNDIRVGVDRAIALAEAETAPAPEPVPASPPAAPAAPPAPAAGLTDEAAFWDVLRATNVLGPKISDEEFSGTRALLAAFAGTMPLGWAAYGLATAWLETAGTMHPIKEIGGETYFRRMYDIEGARPEKARELGNLTPGDGARFAGRGYPQLTGRNNYAKATAKLRALGFDVDLVANPDDAMRPDVAAAIMVWGMREGWFTGKRLNDYINNSPTRTQYVNARRIINGTDRAGDIADAAVVFERALRAGGWK
jgi:putative chitinase